MRVRGAALASEAGSSRLVVLRVGLDDAMPRGTLDRASADDSTRRELHGATPAATLCRLDRPSARVAATVGDTTLQDPREAAWAPGERGAQR